MSERVSQSTGTNHTNNGASDQAQAQTQTQTQPSSGFSLALALLVENHPDVDLNTRPVYIPRPRPREPSPARSPSVADDLGLLLQLPFNIRDPIPVLPLQEPDLSPVSITRSSEHTWLIRVTTSRTFRELLERLDSTQLHRLFRCINHLHSCTDMHSGVPAQMQAQTQDQTKIETETQHPPLEVHFTETVAVHPRDEDRAVLLRIPPDTQPISDQPGLRLGAREREGTPGQAQAQTSRSRSRSRSPPAKTRREARTRSLLSRSRSASPDAAARRARLDASARDSTSASTQTRKPQTRSQTRANQIPLQDPGTVALAARDTPVVEWRRTRGMRDRRQVPTRMNRVGVRVLMDKFGRVPEGDTTDGR